MNYMFTDHQALQKVPADQKWAAFIAYAKKAIEGYSSGKTTMQDAAYTITGAASIPEINQNPAFDSILELSGELELPPNHIQGSVEAKWQTLLTEIDRAEQKLT